MESILRIQGLTKAFTGLTAVNELDLHVEPGKILGIIGPNGAGKTTLFNMITGVLAPSRGQIFFGTSDITNMPPYKIARKGISRTFQNLKLFKRLTVLDNVMAGLCYRIHPGIMGCLFGLGIKKYEETEAQIKALEAIEFMGLNGKEDITAGSLPYGEQKNLEIARALVAEPKILLLDEPAAGMNPSETEQLMKNIEKINGKGVTILLIEHNMQLAMGVSKRIVVLNYGVKIAEDVPWKIQNDSRVIEAYLGTREDYVAN